MSIAEVSSSSESTNRLLRASWSCRQHSSTGLSSGEYDGNVTKARSSRAARSVTADAWKYGAPSRTTIKSSLNSLHNAKMKCFAWSAVTYSSNREKKRSPSSVIAPSRHVQSRWPDSSTEGRVPRGNHAARGSTCTDFLV